MAGSLGGAAGSAYAVTGDTVNTTSRLLAAAAPGTILVSEATQALVRHGFAFEPAGELALRGKAEPIVVHRLLGALAEPASARGLAALGLAAPLVGRADELEQLLAAFDRMRRGRAQVVSLVGEAGTGKSRLIAEFFTRLDADGRLAGTAVRRAACSSLGEPTYGVFGALFREAYQVERTDSLDVARQKLAAGLRALGARDEEASAIAPVLSYVLGLEGEIHPDVEPEQLRRQIALAARALIERRLEREPLLILVEDLHWADTASVDLLRQVVDQLADRPLMLLLSHRPDTRPPLVTRAAQSVIRIAPLSADETRTAGGRPVRRIRRSGATSRLRRHPGRGQSLLRRGDRPEPRGQGRARAPGRSLDVPRGRRGRGRAAHAPRACCSRASIDCPPMRGGSCRRPPCWGPYSTRPLLGAVATEARTLRSGARPARGGRFHPGPRPRA